MINFIPGFDTLGGLAALILGFGFIIFVHELGHFLVAKWVGIRATQFAIGFGPAIVTWRKGIGVRVGSTEPEYERRARQYLEAQGVDINELPENRRMEKIFAAADALGLGETEYRLNYVPLGGYVKMLGQEDIDPAARSDDPRSFTSRPVWARMAVISAGVIMNLIFAMVFFIIAFMSGVAFPPATIGEVLAQSPAATTYAVGHEKDEKYRGLKFGDRVLAVNGKPPMDFTDLQLAAALSAEGEKIQLLIERDGEPQPLTYEIEPKKLNNLYTIGVQPPATLVLVSKLERGQSWPLRLQKAGVEMGMVATAVNGRAVTNYRELEAMVNASQGQPVQITFESPEDSKSATLTIHPIPFTLNAEGKSVSPLGLEPAVAVDQVVPQSPAEKLGIKPGDILVQVGTVRWPSSLETVSKAVQAAGRSPIAVTVLRDGKLLTLGEIAPDDGRLGIHMQVVAEHNYIADIQPDSPLAALELTSGSRILAINGQPVRTYNDLLRHIAALAEPGQIEVEYELNLANRPVNKQQVAIDEATLKLLQSTEWFVMLPFINERVLIRTDSPIEAAKLGLKKTHQTMLSVYVTLARLVDGRVPPKELRGPIGIADMGTQIARDQGITYLIYFLGLISVNLAVVNFLPIPVVDGGHMVFLIAEKIKGSPVSPKVQIGATYVGLVLILCLFVMVTYFDASRLVTNLLGRG